MIDAYSGLNLISLLPSDAYTASTNGTGVDVTDYVGNVMIILDSSAVGTDDETLDVKIQSSSDNSTWSDISGAAFTQVTTSASLQKIKINIDAQTKYIRAVATIAGTSPSAKCSVHMIGYKQVKS